MPSNHLILCHPLLLLPSTIPSNGIFSNESALRIRWPKCWNFSFSTSPSKQYPGLISFKIDWFDLLTVQGTLKTLIRALIPSWGVHPHNLITSPRLHLLIPSHWGAGFHHMNLGVGAQAFSTKHQRREGSVNRWVPVEAARTQAPLPGPSENSLEHNLDLPSQGAGRMNI